MKKEIMFADCESFRVIPCYDVHDATISAGMSDKYCLASFLSKEEADSFVVDSDLHYLKVVTSKVIEIQVYDPELQDNKSIFFNFAGKNRLLEKHNDTKIEREAALSKLTDKEKKLLGLV
jgi:hypothetical protein